MKTVLHDVLDVYGLDGAEIVRSVTPQAAASLLDVKVEELLFSLDYMAFFLPIAGKAYVVNPKQLNERLLAKGGRGSIAKLIEKAEACRKRAVVLYDADGSFCFLSHSAAEAAEKIGARPAHLSKNKKPEFHSRTLVGRYYVRSMLDVFDVSSGIQACIGLDKLRNGAQYVYVYDYNGHQIARCNGVSGVCQRYGLTASPVSRAIKSGRPVWAGHKLYFFSRMDKTRFPLKESEEGYTFRLWKLTSDIRGKVLISTFNVIEIAKYLDVKKALVYDAAKNFRKIAGHYRVHLTEVAELTLDV